MQAQNHYVVKIMTSRSAVHCSTCNRTSLQLSSYSDGCLGRSVSHCPCRERTVADRTGVVPGFIFYKELDLPPLLDMQLGESNHAKHEVWLAGMKQVGWGLGREHVASSYEHLWNPSHHTHNFMVCRLVLHI